MVKVNPTDQVKYEYAKHLLNKASPHLISSAIGLGSVVNPFTLGGAAIAHHRGESPIEGALLGHGIHAGMLIGALTGGVGGGLLGNYLSDGDFNPTAIGAGLGGLLGSGIGGYGGYRITEKALQ